MYLSRGIFYCMYILKKTNEIFFASHTVKMCNFFGEALDDSTFSNGFKEKQTQKQKKSFFCFAVLFPRCGSRER
jgi:hypothetical protein